MRPRDQPPPIRTGGGRGAVVVGERLGGQHVARSVRGGRRSAALPGRRGRGPCRAEAAAQRRQGPARPARAARRRRRPRSWDGTPDSPPTRRRSARPRGAPAGSRAATRSRARASPPRRAARPGAGRSAGGAPKTVASSGRSSSTATIAPVRWPVIAVESACGIGPSERHDDRLQRIGRVDEQPIAAGLVGGRLRQRDDPSHGGESTRSARRPRCRGSAGPWRPRAAPGASARRSASRRGRGAERRQRAAPTGAPP